MAHPQHPGPPADPSEDVRGRPAPPPARTTAYGPDPAQVYDLRLPEGRALTTGVVVVHGGFWRAEHDRSHAACQAQALADAGHPTAVLEYRRAGMPGGGWPGTADDVAAAVAAVRADPAMPDRLVLVGHSAGGHLVAWAAGEPWAAGLAGVVDLQAAFEKRLGDGAVEAFLGATPDTRPEAYAAADPSRHVPRVPVALVHGADDDVVPAAISQAYAEQVGEARGAAPVTLAVVEGCEHFGL
ncbi:MAG TPA: prolyl oligopeptidase family serine peptidase, partial [Pedococcus sp.]